MTRAEKRKMTFYLFFKGFKLETLYLLDVENLRKLAKEYGYQSNVVSSVE